jgi:hypothetical protein
MYTKTSYYFIIFNTNFIFNIKLYLNQNCFLANQDMWAPDYTPPFEKKVTLLQRKYHGALLRLRILKNPKCKSHSEYRTQKVVVDTYLVYKT